MSGDWVIPLAVGFGLAALGAPLAPRGRSRLEQGATAFALGALAAPPVALLAGWMGAPWNVSSVLPSLLVLAGLGFWWSRSGQGASRPEATWRSGRFDRAAAALAVAAFAVDLGRVWLSPLWSWDHFAIWGVKARRMAPGGLLDLLTLAAPELDLSRPDHPLGLPTLWLLLSGGRPPGEGVIRLTHGALAAALVVVVAGALARATRSGAVGAAVATALALSPLLSSTSLVGLAELPLAVALGVATAALLADDRLASLRLALALGALPWLKQEGLLLALLLASTAFVVRRRDPAATARDRTALALLAAPLAAAALAFQRFALPPAPGLVSGDWTARAEGRLRLLPDLLGRAAATLSSLDWLGLWWIAPIALAVALVRGDQSARQTRLALALLIAPFVHLTAVVAVAIVGDADPFDQIRAALGRVAASLVVLVVCGTALLLRREPEARRDPADEIPAQT